MSGSRSGASPVKSGSPNRHHLEAMRERARAHEVQRAPFYERTSDARNALLAALRETRDTELMHALGRGPGTSSEQHNPAVEQVVAPALEYVRMCDWSMLDVLTLASAANLPPAKVADALTPAALVYHALRTLDDAVDRHLSYKQSGPTFFGSLAAKLGVGQAAEGLNLLGVFLLTLAGAGAASSTVRALAARTAIGMMNELAAPEAWSLTRYRAMVEGKMVDYGMALYEPVVALLDQWEQNELRPFLRRSFFVAQVANDLHDQIDDATRGQPNYWALQLSSSVAWGEYVPELLQLSDDCAKLQGSVRLYGETRVADLINYVLRGIPDIEAVT